MPETVERAINPMHLEAADKADKLQQAIRFVMGRDNSTYPEAVKVVDATGVDAVLKQREGDDTKAHEKNIAAEALRQKLTHSPGEMITFVLALNDRVMALEGPSEEAEVKAEVKADPDADKKAGAGWGKNVSTKKQ
jgi:hypothetical protein